MESLNQLTTPMPPGAALLLITTTVGMVAFMGWLWARASLNPVRGGFAAVGLMLIWLAVISGLALSGITQRTDTLPPGGLAALGPALLAVGGLLYMLSRPQFSSMLDAIPLTPLVAAQVFRVPVEVMLAILYGAGLLPELLTWHGSNFDIFTGLTAPLVAAVAYRQNFRLVKVWNLLGLLLVANVSLSAILSFSGPTNLINAMPPSDFVMSFPAVWLPAFLVPVAILLHGIVVLKLRIDPQN